jgi:hypothetical protein
MRSFIIVSLLAFFACAANVDCDNRFYHPNDNFSICPPTKWQQKKIAGEIWAFVADGVKTHSNINFVTESFDGTLDEYANAAFEYASQIFKDYKVISQSDFSAKSLLGKKLNSLFVINNISLRQSAYLFKIANNKILIITATTGSDEMPSLDALFDESVKTLEIQK